MAALLDPAELIFDRVADQRRDRPPLYLGLSPDLIGERARHPARDDRPLRA
jgi:hypothetical protein